MDDVDIAIVVLALHGIFKRKKNRKPPGSKKGRIWTKQWLLCRSQYTHENLLADVRLTSPQDYKDFLRIDSETFHKLLNLVTPFI